MLSHEYKTNPRLSQSKLKHILNGVDEFLYQQANPTPSSDSQNLGSAVHLLLLEPHLSDKYIVKLEKKVDRRTKEGRAILEQYDGTETIILSPDEYIAAEEIVKSIKNNTDCNRLLNSCEAFEDVKLYSHKGIDFKAQLDGVGSDFILDLKTTIMLNNEYEIKRTVYKYMYHFQAASYLIGESYKKYYIIFARTKPPYSVFPVQLSSEVLGQGFELFDRACNLYNIAQENNFSTENRIKLI